MLEPRSGVSAQVDRGVDHYREGSHGKAIEVLSDVLADTNSVRAYEYRGRSYYKQQRYEKALSDFRRASQINPDDGEFYFLVGIAQLNLSKRRRALRNFNRALESEIDRHSRILVYYNRGVVHEDFGDTRQAIANYRKTLEVDGSFWRAHFNLVKLLGNAGQYRRAINHANRVITLHEGPKEIQVYMRRARLYFALGKFDKALNDVNVVLSRQPDHFPTLFTRAFIHYERGYYEQALDDVNRVIRGESGVPTLYALKALILVEFDRNQEALSVVNSVLPTDQPRRVRPGVWWARAIALFRIGDHEKALTNVNRALEELPGKSPGGFISKADVYLTKAKILKKLGRRDEARQAINQAIEIHPDNTSLRRFKQKLSS